MLALVDCNNFFVSCERLADPSLEKIPVAVLSSNDGVIISRSDEVKAMGVPMGAPYFKYKDMMRQNEVRVFSVEHRYYIYISKKVMEVIKSFSPKTEVYSIDEAFICLKGCDHINLLQYGRQIRVSLAELIGIPVSVGIAETKTLAKIAAEKAKKNPDAEGVVMIDSSNREEVLENTCIEEIWGIGRKIAEKMYLAGIGTAADLTRKPDGWVRKKFHVHGLRIANELKGLECYPVHGGEEYETHKSIVVSSSFGKNITKLADLQEAVASFTSKAAEKLRRDGLLTCNLTVFLNNNRFLPDELKYKRDAQCKLPYPTDNTGVLLAHARKLIETVYKEGIKYKRCGVLLTELVESHSEQGELFDKRTVTGRSRQNKQVEIIDALNYRFGRGTIFYASQGTKRLWKPHSKLLNAHKTEEKEVYSTRFF